MATKQIGDLSELTTAAASDVLAIVDDPAGTAQTRKITAQNLLASLLYDYLAGLNLSSVLNASEDFVIFLDTSTGTLKKMIGGNITDNDAVHVAVDGELLGIFTQKTLAHGDDLLLLENSEDYYNKATLEAGQFVGVLGTQIANQTVEDTIAQTTLLGTFAGTRALPADALRVGTTIRITVRGMLGTTGTPTLNTKVYIGGTLLCASGADAMGNSITGAPFELCAEFTCRATGASGSIIGAGQLTYADGTILDIRNFGAITVDTTGTLEIDVTALWGTASPSNTITSQVAMIEKLN